jgi:ribose 5-phosphate isomerase B
MAHLEGMGHSCQDFGCYDEAPVDYPDIAGQVALAVVEGQSEKGILVCGTGIGMSMAANKVRGARAALCHNELTALRARQHNDANILCLGADLVEEGLAREIVSIFLNTEFEGGRHQRRLDKVLDMESRGFRSVWVDSLIHWCIL